jgi:hypothetical protein
MDELMAVVFFDAVRKDRVQFGGGACAKHTQSVLNQAVSDTDAAEALAQVCWQKFLRNECIEKQGPIDWATRERSRIDELR